MLTSTKFTGAPLVSVRCNMNKDGSTWYGDWFTPETSAGINMKCWMPCDLVSLGVYDVTIDVLAFSLVHVPVLIQEFSMEARTKPTVDSVSSRFIVNNVVCNFLLFIMLSLSISTVQISLKLAQLNANTPRVLFQQKHLVHHLKLTPKSIIQRRWHAWYRHWPL